MTPEFKILADSKDITRKIADRLLSLSVTDESGQNSDVVEIKLDNRDGAIAMPHSGAELEVYLGYEEIGLTRMGVFIAGDITLSGPPDTMSIKGHAANMCKSLKAPKTKSWDQKTISEIVSTIAAGHGLIPVVAPVLAGIVLQHIDQTEESDLNFLTRLAVDNDAVAKPVESRLLFVPRGEAKSSSGKKLPLIHLDRVDLERWDMTAVSRGKYRSVKSYWYSLDDAERMSVIIGSGEPCFCMGGSSPTLSEARSKAQAKFNELQRGTATLSLSTGGDPTIAAECALTISGVSGLEGSWIVQRVEHSLDDQGYSCHIDCETPTGKSKGVV